jgi:hypothetical protein
VISSKVMVNICSSHASVTPFGVVFSLKNLEMCLSKYFAGKAIVNGGK